MMSNNSNSGDSGTDSQSSHQTSRIVASLRASSAPFLLPEDHIFDPKTLFTSSKHYLRKQVYYQAHACPVYSVGQAHTVLQLIGTKYDSDDCLPYALQLVEDGQYREELHDSVEFLSAKVLATCLHKASGYNVMVCLTRHVKGCYVTDMLHMQKRHVFKTAAEEAIGLLLDHLKNRQGAESPIAPFSPPQMDVQT